MMPRICGESRYEHCRIKPKNHTHDKTGNSYDLDTGEEELAFTVSTCNLLLATGVDISAAGLLTSAEKINGHTDHETD